VTRTFLLTTLVAAVVPLAPPTFQMPTLPVQNGRVETRPATSLDRELTTLGAGPEAVWVAWRVPMVDGDRGSCSTWNTNGTTWYRGEVLEAGPQNTQPPRMTPPSSVSLEAGTQLVMLARLLDGRLERLREVDDSCPIDANGKTVYWLKGITPSESIRYLETLTRQDALNIDSRRRLAEGALDAIALHRDAAADVVLDRTLLSNADANLRQRAASSLASVRGAHGFETLRKAIDAERDANQRRSLVTSLGQTRQPSTAEALLAFARTDMDPRLRAEAVYWYAQRAGQAGVSNVLAIIDRDADDNVKQRAVSGLGRINDATSVQTLIDLARTSKSLPVKKQAVTMLGQSKDSKAVAFLEQLLR
jgi:HEAT repeats